uniref:Uncharacterized protein n=1 Tax=Aureoumbra lagunensis TaxID=44058 RepID=A0A6S8E650_9STRA|mmetsp:Transcript_9926/g.15084  ORF Transcript_9926/g.15084 Transcript_9926/m.15084 type:complete len:129 (+) Transcript_9926:123-509(+)|eukprot:CAMPEP_0197323790 /NCGR_PEP_ID=MMETSP0891-20130614/70735_1 /TAXON_ID=44058 ORGANISM="Aureoumbra lagunensis, Strain CCMP1510" /NCGR_SAMPLE_ID=MMETSP0891 /ASSEMBLY_ACC=CAM_ASM_000534 /LENGTH=128 /DNA_ID=CAMNT_0042816509 /DNA_START=588 /DNA_END=974 /DNA_ORIENTATION=-
MGLANIATSLGASACPVDLYLSIKASLLEPSSDEIFVKLSPDANSATIFATITVPVIKSSPTPAQEFSLPDGTICAFDDSTFILKMMKRKLQVAFPTHTIKAFGDPDDLYKQITLPDDNDTPCSLFTR